MLHRETRNFEAAEEALKQELAIRVQQQDRGGEAGSLTELGNLYNAMERWEEAATFYRRAADIYFSLPDLNHEGAARGNLANVFIKLLRYDEARTELQRAIECSKPFGHAAEPWIIWHNLHTLELAVGDLQAAAQARQQAMQSYLAYRRDGGGDHENTALAYNRTALAIQQAETAEAEQALVQLIGDTKIRPQRKIAAAKLCAILKGDRNPALSSDPELDYQDAAELQLLLERLNAQ